MEKIKWIELSSQLLMALVLAFCLNERVYSQKEISQPSERQGKKLFADLPASHEQKAAVSVLGTDGKQKLQTLGMDAEGRALALTAPPKNFGPPLKDVTSEAHVYSPNGKPVVSMKVDFHANSLTGGPDGNIYVAGDGQVAKFSREGKFVITIDLPHVGLLLKDADSLKKQAEDQVNRQRESMQNILKTYKERLAILENKKAEERSKLEQRQLDQYHLIIKNFEVQKPGNDTTSIEKIVAQITGRLRTIASITFSTKDVFIACGDTKGFGYAVWRMDHDFKNPTQILAGVAGCCGQMDIQASGSDLLVAENTKHRFARYDRNGNEIGAWGQRGRETELECFGGCCNPMNLSSTKSGDIFTAESEGLIKRFSPKGDFLGLVATTSLSGTGCKNVAFSVSPDEQRIYFLDLNGSRFLILNKK